MTHFNFFKFLIAFTLIGLPLFVCAAQVVLPLVPCGQTGQDPCTLPCFFVMIDRIINFLLFAIAMPLSVTALMVAGIMLIFSSSENSLKQGKDIFKFTVIGLFIAFGAWLLIDLILGNLLSTGYKPWDNFPSAC